MKFKSYLALIADPNGFIPTPRFQWVIRKNTRPTAREEAIAAKILEDADPRENITRHFPWGPEQQLILQQFWLDPCQPHITPDHNHKDAEWRDVPIKGAEDLYTNVPTEFGDMPVPNAVKEPGVVQGDFRGRIEEMLGEGDEEEQ